MAILIVIYLANSIEYEMLKVFYEKNAIQLQMEVILSNLEEAVITKSDAGSIGVCNKKGHYIIDSIHSTLPNSKPSHSTRSSQQQNSNLVVYDAEQTTAILRANVF